MLYCLFCVISDYLQVLSMVCVSYNGTAACDVSAVDRTVTTLASVLVSPSPQYRGWPELGWAGLGWAAAQGNQFRAGICWQPIYQDTECAALKTLVPVPVPPAAPIGPCRVRAAL